MLIRKKKHPPFIVVAMLLSICLAGPANAAPQQILEKSAGRLLKFSEFANHKSNKLWRMDK